MTASHWFKVKCNAKRNYIHFWQVSIWSLNINTLLFFTEEIIQPKSNEGFTFQCRMFSACLYWVLGFVFFHFKQNCIVKCSAEAWVSFKCETHSLMTLRQRFIFNKCVILFSLAQNFLQSTRSFCKIALLKELICRRCQVSNWN